MEYSDYVAQLRRLDTGLAEEVARFHNLENVLGWMKERGLPLGSLDLVTRDEFSHDVLIPLEGRWLAFGIT